MTKPNTRDERLRDILATTVGICWGMGGYDERLVAFGSGFPGGGGGGGSKGSVSRPVEAQVVANVDEGRVDPATEMGSAFDRRLEAAQRALEALWDEYKRVVQPRLGVSKVNDPGCELCAEVPDHWCMTFASVDVTSAPRRKGAEPTVRKVRLCSWCYQFARPDRAGRMPSAGEVELHAQGRRVRWKVGA